MKDSDQGLVPDRGPIPTTGANSTSGAIIFRAIPHRGPIENFHTKEAYTSYRIVACRFKIMHHVGKIVSRGLYLLEWVGAITVLGRVKWLLFVPSHNGGGDGGQF